MSDEREKAPADESPTDENRADEAAAEEEASAGSASTEDTESEQGAESGQDEDTDEVDEIGQRGAGRRRASPLLLGLVILTVLALVGVGLLGKRAWDVRVEADARREATRTAEKAADAILAYDHRHLDRDLRRASRYTTGKFAEEYEKTSTNVLRKTAPEVEAKVRAEVMASSVVRASKDQVVCLLFVNQTTKSNVRDQAVPDRNRVRMTMTRVDDAWKVSDMDAL